MRWAFFVPVKALHSNDHRSKLPKKSLSENYFPIKNVFDFICEDTCRVVSGFSMKRWLVFIALDGKVKKIYCWMKIDKISSNSERYKWVNCFLLKPTEQLPSVCTTLFTIFPVVEVWGCTNIDLDSSSYEFKLSQLSMLLIQTAIIFGYAQDQIFIFNSLTRHVFLIHFRYFFVFFFFFVIPSNSTYVDAQMDEFWRNKKIKDARNSCEDEPKLFWEETFMIMTTTMMMSREGFGPIK